MKRDNGAVKSFPGAQRTLPKSATGIHGLDQITGGGLPKGRPTLICGGAGCGKTLFGLEFLVHGATDFGEPGAFITFEETGDELAQNVRSLGFDLDQLVKDNKIAIDYVRVERNEIDETGDYDLEGLFLRIGLAIDSVGAKRVVLDTIESLFAGFENLAVLRAELRRLFRWLKDRGVTAVITGERGGNTLTRQGLEEYVSDCVILLDHRVSDQVSTRRLRVVKYRGTTHGTSEYPFLIDEGGISVLPITALGLDHEVSDERIPSGIPRLDTMLGGKGYYKGSSILVSGTAGTGKTSIACSLAYETARRGGRCLYLAFEESPAQLTRNMRSIGMDFGPYLEKGLIRMHASRPNYFGLEAHLVQIHKMVVDFDPEVVIIDPISNFASSANPRDTSAMLLRVVDFLKGRQITALLTHLTNGANVLEATDVGISSIIDTWLLVRDIELGGERNRGLYVLKSRGMHHSNQIREFLITSAGIQLQDVYVGPEGVLTGSMRAAQEDREKTAEVARQQAAERREREINRQRTALEAQIAALRAEFDALDSEAQLLCRQDETQQRAVLAARDAAAARRGADKPNGSKPKRGETAL
ncbi:MAG TPA: circadian clock protein KaiC [Burkholderiales bacterium]|jgi:circadian clock protein KaiC|nr:circadian clock protein KaiC [Burkholderiales bacterium]